MNVTRHGKIARLPKAVRDELNRRLENGQSGKRLVAWLNKLPQVRHVLAEDFGGKPIREQNLSEWKAGGYGDWVAQQEALKLAARLGEDTAELRGADQPPLTDTLALWLAARYAVATRQVSAAEGADGWRLLREFCADIVELRRSDHTAARLKIEQERLERERRVRGVFGRSPEPPAEPATGGPESDPVNGQEPAPIKPDQTKSN
jgi:hypothetical protein